MSKSASVPFFRTEFNYDRNKASDESGLACLDPSRAKQSMLEETDINTIVRRFGVTGVVPMSVRSPTYGDFTGVSDYQSALHAIMVAENSFMQMPADVRKRFNNDPQEFVEFCSNPDNSDEMRKLGLVTPEAPVPEPQATGTEPTSP